MMKYLFLSFIILSGCIGIPTDYPENEYYAISREGQDYFGKSDFPYSIYIEQLNMSSELDDIFIKFTNSENKVEKYHYHRWSNSPSNMLETYFTTMIIKSKIFSSGVFITSKRILPDYVLTIDVIQFDAYSDKVDILMNFNIVSYDQSDSKNQSQLQKTYFKSIERSNKSVASIPKAFNEAINQIGVEFLKDITEKLTND